MSQRDTLVMVKLGGSVITDKAQPFAERRDTINRLAKEIHSLKEQTGLKLIVGHGGGSYPHGPAHEFNVQKGIINAASYRGIALVQDAAARLNRIVVTALLKTGENAISVQPSSAVIAKSSKIVHWDTEAITKMVELTLLPVVYGDVGLDVDQGCCILSTEEIFRFLARSLGAKRILIGSNVNGVFTKDPRVFDDVQQIPVITPKNVNRVLPSLGGAGTTDVTGGMRTKVLTLLELVKEMNVECEILDATIPGMLEEALKGKRGKGTIIRNE